LASNDLLHRGQVIFTAAPPGTSRCYRRGDGGQVVFMRLFRAAGEKKGLFSLADGDFAKIGRLWDRGSEKTLRKLVREYGLGDALDAARSRQKDP